MCVAGLFSADGERFFTLDSVGRQGLVRIWDVSAGKLAKSIPLAIPPNGRLALRESDGEIGIDFSSGEEGKYNFGLWNIETGQLDRRVEMKCPIGNFFSFVSDDGRWYGLPSSRNQTVQFVDLNTGKTILDYEGITNPNHGPVSLDGRYAAVPSYGAVYLFRMPK